MVRDRDRVLRVGPLAFAAIAGLSCATPLPHTTLTLEQHSLRIPLAVSKDRTVSLAESPPLVGRIDLAPILEAEGVPADKPTATVQLMIHYGRIYIVADGFRSIWEITPVPGTSTASYRPIPIVEGAADAPLKDVRLCRYGSSGSPCLRLDRVGGDPVFITVDGEARHDCP